MRIHDYLTGDGLDFSVTDARFAALLAEADWLTAEAATRARAGLREVW